MKNKTIRTAYLDIVGITLITVLVISILLPAMFYLMAQPTLSELLKEAYSILIIFTVLTFTIAGVIVICDRIPVRFPAVKSTAEIVLIILLTYLFLDGIYLHLEDSPSAENYKLFIGMNALGTVFIFLFQKGMFMKQKAAEKAHQTELLQKDFNQFRLQALKNQVNPHFLFNSLSVLSSLVHRDAALAEQFVVRLSQAYTYILSQKEAGLVPLDEEMRFLRSYFFLLKIRFGEKLQLETDVPDTNGGMVPPLILQLLLENAVKHNKMSAHQPLKVSIRRRGDRLIVENNISRRDSKEESTGLGLENIRKRYGMITDAEVTITQTDARFSVVIPVLPVESAGTPDATPSSNISLL
ncbi:MAG TPA: histidine kinase [Sphingobacteriaceae bacterium]